MNFHFHKTWQIYLVSKLYLATLKNIFDFSDRYPIKNIIHITVDDIKSEISFDDPIDKRNGNRKLGLIRTYFAFSFYNVENYEKIHFNNGEIIKLKGAVIL